MGLRCKDYFSNGTPEGRRVQPEEGLKSQNRAEHWPANHRDGRDSEAEREAVGLNHGLETRVGGPLVVF